MNNIFTGPLEMVFIVLTLIAMLILASIDISCLATNNHAPQVTINPCKQ